MLTISQVAKGANVNVETVRYYQRRGLLPEPKKPLGGHRRYFEQDVSRLQFIKRAQVLGFTLDEIENLLRLDGADCCADTHDLAVRKLALIDEKMARLAAMRQALSGLVRQCEIGNHGQGCPIIQSLAQE
jgi:MerR family mercuric resistance operon transcriptional regulator